MPILASGHIQTPVDYKQMPVVNRSPVEMRSGCAHLEYVALGRIQFRLRSARECSIIQKLPHCFAEGTLRGSNTLPATRDAATSIYSMFLFLIHES